PDQRRRVAALGRGAATARGRGQRAAAGLAGQGPRRLHPAADELTASAPAPSRGTGLVSPPRHGRTTPPWRTRRRVPPGTQPLRRRGSPLTNSPIAPSTRRRRC